MEYHLKKPHWQHWNLILPRRYQSTALLSTRPSASPKTLISQAKNAFEIEGFYGIFSVFTVFSKTRFDRQNLIQILKEHLYIYIDCEKNTFFKYSSLCNITNFLLNS